MTAPTTTTTTTKALLLPLLVALLALLLPATGAMANATPLLDAAFEARLGAMPAVHGIVARFAAAHPAAMATLAAAQQCNYTLSTRVLVNVLYGLHRAYPERFAMTLDAEGAGVPLVIPDGHRDVLTMDELGPLALAVRDTAQQLWAQHSPQAKRTEPLLSTSSRADNGTSRCNVTGNHVECTYNVLTIFTGLEYRDVMFEFPLSPAPADGWPVAVHYQGSFASPHWFSWNAFLNYPFGAYYQTLTIKELLDRGYLVLTPECHLNGFFFWDTNVPFFKWFWDLSLDDRLIERLLDELYNPTGTFGLVNRNRIYATGISSGGYMTSRMAVSYNGKFRALAVHSGSYATCAGILCSVPDLPADHPPTMFLHGGSDLIVPPYTMEMYADQMTAQGLENQVVMNPSASHEWIPEAVTAVPDWFDRHP